MKIKQILKNKMFLVGALAAIGKLGLDYLTTKAFPDIGTILLFVGLTGIIGLMVLAKKPSPIKAALVGASGLIAYNFIASIILGVSFNMGTAISAGIETAGIAFLVYLLLKGRSKK